jgi:aspartate aminotransferase
MSPSLSQRVGRVPASPIRRLTPLAEDAVRRGVVVHHLNIGQPDLATPAPMREHAKQVPEIFAYTPSQGTDEVLAMLSDYYARFGVSVGPREILVTTGGSEALSFAFLACADPGEEALVPEPFYTNYGAFAAMAGVTIAPLTTRAEDGFHLPGREAFERALSPRTRMIVLCNPNNPTGTVYRPEEIEMVASLCRDRGLFLVVDEVYREFVYDGREPSTALALSGMDDHLVVVDSFSKRYSACGMRLGCFVTRHAELYAACLRMAQGRLSAPGLAQLAALGAAELGPEYSEGVVAEYAKRRDVLYEGLRAIPGVFLERPEGAFYFVARLPIRDGDDFARFMLSEFALDGETVMVAPAEGFYASPGLGRDEVRIAYVLGQAELETSVRILRAGLAAYRTARGL